MTGLVERLRALHVWPQIVADNFADILSARHIAGLYTVGAGANEAADRITALEAQLQTVLDRESATTARYDAKLDALEAQVAAADRLAGEASFASAILHNLSMGRPILDTALAAYRTAKGE